MTNALQVVKDPALSLIENINIDAVKGTIDKVRQLQATLKGILKEGHDYGLIPGCGDKPTLLKPGAEKILMALGLTSSYDFMEHTENFKDKGFFAYTIKCVLSTNNGKITEGLGHANSKETKWAVEWVTDKKIPEGTDIELLQKQKRTGAYGDYFVYKVDADANSKANTILKMAKKRSQIDAVLTVASLSEIFTQDFDDLPNQDDENPNTDVVNKTKQKAKPKAEVSSEIFVCEECGVEINEAIHKFSTGKFGKALCYEHQQPYKTQK